MANFVVKADGSKVPFDANKLRVSIEGAASDAGLSAEAAAPTVSQVFGVALGVADSKDEITTAELKQAVLGELDKVKPEISAAWRRYDEEKGKK